MRETKRVRLSPEARRAQLIELGVDLLATRRLDELSVELIAKTAGISRGLLFHYFSSKQEFHVEVARAAAAELIARTEPDPAAAPLEALRGGLTAFVDYVADTGDGFNATFATARCLSGAAATPQDPEFAGRGAQARRTRPRRGGARVGLTRCAGSVAVVRFHADAVARGRRV